MNDSSSTPFAVPAELLASGGKMLFIAHLALGDYTYLQNFFKAFAQAHPGLQIHLWVDEVRRTSKREEWKFLKSYALYDWVEACPFFEKVYRRTYSPELFQESIAEAQREAYPLVVSLATLRPHFYAGLAREISPNGFVAGMKPRTKLTQLHHLPAYRKLDAAISPDAPPGMPEAHITDVYGGWFRQLFGLELPPAGRQPFVDIPAPWIAAAHEQLRQWEFPEGATLVFINPYAKTVKRCWPLEKVAALIREMRAQPSWRDACFIVNAVPERLEEARNAIEHQRLERTRIFSAQENFFQLPALLKQCDLIISVETAVMHLANAVGVPVIALMRQKNPEWAPIDRENSIVITAAKRSDWVKEIPVAAVMNALAAAR
ncbi:glycosyltransferase family 9 protein [Noviherbaspirillum pedocola]|uniref:Glycosyltransferase family 9 protein n=1 Tax=Noviherbaspirillum pedocola TaxID=2801341 RepID=A0A934W449_9BURK|nr:glycosyltransferase family 9 protein [Noviherbaspirillum pedocola]MBK4733512.1 glycosyltransferase family 9 protein [Noviherbaspirillum pedocola]